MRLPADAGTLLLPLARSVIASGLGQRVDTPGAQAAWLDQPGAGFVTLTMAGKLRGCIGTIDAHRALRNDITSNARAAAFHDRRFGPLSAAEYRQIRVEVSVLTTPEPIAFNDRADALNKLVPNVDGIVLTLGVHRATFLPQVWEQLPRPEEFLQALLRKAGLAGDHWDSKIKLERYHAQVWTEADHN